MRRSCLTLMLPNRRLCCSQVPGQQIARTKCAVTERRPPLATQFRSASWRHAPFLWSRLEVLCSPVSRAPVMARHCRSIRRRWLWRLCCAHCCPSDRWQRRGGPLERQWSYLALIRPVTVIKSATQPSGTAKALRSRRRAHAGPGKRRRTANSDRDIPGPACIFASSTPLPARSSMSSQYPHLVPRQTPLGACAARSRASQRKLHHEPPFYCASRQIQNTRRLWFAGSCLLRGCSAILTYCCGNASWQMLHRGRLSLSAPNGGP
jgi:hypothetical protein